MVQKMEIIKETERANRSLKDYKKLNEKLQKIRLKINKIMEEINWYIHRK